VAGVDGTGAGADGTAAGLPKVAVDGVSKRYTGGSGAVQALADVSFEVRDGEFVCIVGPSGCGKTTLFQIIAGLESASEGEVRLDGDPLTGPGMDRGMVFQEYLLFPWRTVLENVVFGLEQQDLGADEREARAREMLELVGLADVADQYPRELSGGMKQRVGIARALAVDPDILLMDEPFGSVDAQTRDMLHEELLEIWAETGKTVLFVTHDVDEAVTLADRVVVLAPAPGRVREVVEIDLERPRRRTDDAFADREAYLRDLIGE
jgi:NitT/TauT family transport system ATP-binding protein